MPERVEDHPASAEAARQAKRVGAVVWVVAPGRDEARLSENRSSRPGDTWKSTARIERRIVSKDSVVADIRDVEIRITIHHHRHRRAQSIGTGRATLIATIGCKIR